MKAVVTFTFDDVDLVTDDDVLQIIDYLETRVCDNDFYLKHAQELLGLANTILNKEQDIMDLSGETNND